MPDTLTLDAPGTIADAEQEASGASLVETSLPEAVETAGADAATETESPDERTPEEIRAELAELRKELKGADFRKEQALKDQRAQLERDLREAAEAQSHQAARQRADAIATQQFAGAMLGITQAIENGQHLGDDGQPKRLPDGTPLVAAWVNQRAKEFADAVALRELDTLTDLMPATFQEKYPDWKQPTDLTTALNRARRNGDVAAVWAAQFALAEDAITSGLSPKLRKQVEAELTEAASKDEAAGGVEKAAKAREAAPKATTIAGGVAAPNANWRSLPPMSKGYRDGFIRENGYDPLS
jgi:hypothetical protein